MLSTQTFTAVENIANHRAVSASATFPASSGADQAALLLGVRVGTRRRWPMGTNNTYAATMSSVPAGPSSLQATHERKWSLFSVKQSSFRSKGYATLSIVLA